MMSISDFRAYYQSLSFHASWIHWVIIGILSLLTIVFLLFRKKYPVYSSIAFGLTFFVFLFLLEAAVLSRFNDNISHSTRYDFIAEYQRLFHGNTVQRIQILLNFLIFIPFGFFLSEFLSSIKRFGFWHQIGFITLVGFGLSLCFESIQLVFHLGLFEITDLVMNTLGAFVGSGIALLGRALFNKKGRSLS